MIKIQNAKQYDLEERTFKFAENVRNFVKNIPKAPIVLEDIKQLVRASGSIGANYIEANESLSKKDFIMRIMICRKEAKETRYWLNLIYPGNDLEKVRNGLINEATQLMKIFGSILEKSK